MADGTESREPEDAPASDKRTRPYSESVEDRSDYDAMGNDKRREVVGGQYGATVRKRVMVYGIALGVIVAIVVGFLTVVSGIDNKEIALEDTGPWTAAGTSQEAPRDIDYRANGPDDTIPTQEIVNR